MVSTERPRGLTTERLFAVILAGLGLLVLAAGLSGAYALDRTAAVSNRLADRISPAATQVVVLRAALIDQETGVRGFALTGDRAFLAPYEQGVAAERTAAIRIRELLHDEGAALTRLDAVAGAAAGWRAGYAEPVVAAGGPGADPALQGSGKAAFDGLRDAVSQLQDTVGEARLAARDDLDAARQWRDLVFVLIVVVFIAGLIGVAVLLRFVVLRPLRGLGGAARQVAAGDFDHELPRRGPVDLRLLADDLDDMRRQIAEALARSLETGRRLEQRTTELSRSNRDLEQFAYVASHDLQEPLRKVAAFCQLLQRRYDPILDDRGREYVRFAVDGATRMQALINDLLVFSRVGRVYDDVTEVALDGVLRAVESDLSYRIEGSAATIVRPALPVVHGDPTLLALLWQNLLSNALKFARPDVPPRIEIAATRDDAGWCFAVTDNGIGIEPQYQEKIFVLFQRLHARTEYPGTGIGLAVCKRIVEFHGGRIWLDDEHSGGARLLFTLPDRAPGPG